MIVVCLEGPHGSGKTQLTNSFEQAGFEVLDEAFMDMPTTGLHPQSLVMEVTWLSFWFQRLLRKHQERLESPSHAEGTPLPGGGKENMKPGYEKNAVFPLAKLPADGVKHDIFIADRSPFSAVFYANHGQLLHPIIQKQTEELREAGIYIYTAYIRTDAEILWARICNRLKVEPHRVKYNENSREWMETTLSFYEGQMWDLSVNNNNISIQDLMHRLIDIIDESLNGTFVHNCPPSVRESPMHSISRKRVMAPISF